ncbi:MAG: PKD domain-containing protein, partial [Bacteroidota bacterium]
DVTIAGGSQPFSFDWNGIANTEDLDAATVGKYSLSIIDLHGCEVQSDSFLISEPDPLHLNGTSNPISCFGETDGALSVVTTGGVGNYTYLWSTGDTLPSIADIGEGSYALSVQDSNACTVDTTFDLVAPAPLQATVFEVLPTSCPGALDGTITLDIVGGTVPYTTFAVAADSTGTFELNALDSGLYIFEVIDSAGCQFMGDTVLIDQDNTPPLARFSFIKEDPQVTLTDSSFAADNILWDFGDGNTSQDLNPTYTYSTNGTFTITQIASSRCGSDTARQEVTIETVSLDPILDREWRLYPNPNDGSFTIVFANLPSLPSSWYLWDLQGKKISGQKILRSQSQVTIHLPDP